MKYRVAVNNNGANSHTVIPFVVWWLGGLIQQIETNSIAQHLVRTPKNWEQTCGKKSLRHGMLINIGVAAKKLQARIGDTAGVL